MTDVICNEIIVSGTHFMFSMINDMEELRVHPAISMLGELLPETLGEIVVKPMVEHVVIRAAMGEDKYEIILLRHDFPHDDPESQKFCDARPYQIILGGEIYFYPEDRLANWPLNEAHAEYQRIVDAAKADGATLITLV